MKRGEKQFENDTTLTFPIMREAMRAVLPLHDSLLCYLFSVVLTVRFVFLLTDCIQTHTFSLKIILFLLITIGTAAYPLLIFPWLFGFYRYRDFCKAFHSNAPHITFSLYDGEIEARLPNSRKVQFPYSTIKSIKKTHSLIILSFQDEKDLYLRLDSFHGSSGTDVVPFLKHAFKACRNS